MNNDGYMMPTESRTGWKIDVLAYDTTMYPENVTGTTNKYQYAGAEYLKITMDILPRLAVYLVLSPTFLTLWC